MGIKRYGINWFGTLDLIVEIDHDIMTEEKLHQINNFWTDSKGRLTDEDGNILHVVLKILGRRCFHLCTADWFDGSELAAKFDEEGWPPMDGSHGIRIIDCDELEFDVSDITVSEIVE
ncbi:uncharacterized protein DUF2528 [Serratia fonticola]|uniref:Uncharacterized protein DUF2528 n=1 Tax=Serratia fonticola TaxID=47917 RepID=A0A542D835_SERFO|nr:DUF2528 family protein [Serratia fonticola]TQI78729.1 uncharacterized protein DUF2528 [Serratia fonticola]TQI99249.1 uncharacterized protein DUF2528 [Serratia fonticola]TVZ68774.1 uncharacterized protein DUF2528 [Serratia fonticola]